MMRLVGVLVYCILSFSVNAQSDSLEMDTLVYSFVEFMPEYPSGKDGLLKFLRKNVRYPSRALENEVSGTVTVDFIVEKDGGLSNVKVKQPINNELDRESIRVIRKMPKWKPGRQGGKTVRVYSSVPIIFTIE